ncbi:mRNA cap guanine-N7 methyltransferase [Coccomyxa sp. Obi]|nr:mRNA cap guanine-N7 methyltransferase [Coccomyxa sp. Obi]
MDADAVRKTREHYNSHANNYADRSQALDARRQGAALPLKEFHNAIKRKMILRFAGGADSLLDFACGRGGDIHKWAAAKIKYVKGIDLSPGEIEEARRRFAEHIERRNPRQQGPLLEAEFVDSDQLGLSMWKEPQQYDAVTCMFAIHYFFVTERALDTFLHNVAINLKDGGYFFGTFPSGKRVQDTIHRFGSWPQYNAPMLQLQALWKGNVASFGCAYTCAIGDTVTQGVGATEGSYEYLVFNSTLIGVAAKHGLKPVCDWGDPELDDCFDEADAQKPIKHFHPRFPSHSDRSLTYASALFAAFAFQKSGTEQQHRSAGNQSSQKEVVRSGAADAHERKRRREDSKDAGPSQTTKSAAELDAGDWGNAEGAKGLKEAGKAASAAYKRPKPREARTTDAREKDG